jgi:hypothetical protein
MAQKGPKHVGHLIVCNGNITKLPVSAFCFEMWCWRRMEKLSWTDRMRNEVLYGVKDGRNILHTIKRRKAKWIGHILRRNCFLKHVIEGKLEGR